MWPAIVNTFGSAGGSLCMGRGSGFGAVAYRARPEAVSLLVLVP